MKVTTLNRGNGNHPVRKILLVRETKVKIRVSRTGESSPQRYLADQLTRKIRQSTKNNLRTLRKKLAIWTPYKLAKKQFIELFQIYRNLPHIISRQTIKAQIPRTQAEGGLVARAEGISTNSKTLTKR